MKNLSLSQLNILVVDDEAITQQVLVAFLSEITQQPIYTANNGIEALDILNKHPLDILLTDINMPFMNGIELTKTIRNSQEDYKNIIILGITANTDEKILNSAKTAGMNSLLIKPISAQLLTEKIMTLVT